MAQTEEFGRLIKAQWTQSNKRVPSAAIHRPVCELVDQLTLIAKKNLGDQTRGGLKRLMRQSLAADFEQLYPLFDGLKVQARLFGRYKVSFKKETKASDYTTRSTTDFSKQLYTTAWYREEMQKIGELAFGYKGGLGGMDFGDILKQARSRGTKHFESALGRLTDMCADAPFFDPVADKVPATKPLDCGLTGHMLARYNKLAKLCNFERRSNAPGVRSRSTKPKVVQTHNAVTNSSGE